jgi:FkbM family methyltransferase
MHSPGRRYFGDRDVQRTVQGVRLSLPRSHLLPVYARVRSSYGQNLVQLASGLSESSGATSDPLEVLDVGANVGDSTLQIIAGANARVLSVEADPYWARYLRRNVEGNSAVTVEESLLLPEGSAMEAAQPIRHHGTSRFTATMEESDSPTKTTPSDLRARHPEFDHVRLIKSDTDGYDTVIIPAVARAWSESTPVLFFEFDPELVRQAGYDPHLIWHELADLGYSGLAIWDNAGDPLGQLDISEVEEFSRSIEPKPVQFGYHFWDVAARHQDDDRGREILERLMPMKFDIRGTWR